MACPFIAGCADFSRGPESAAVDAAGTGGSDGASTDGAAISFATSVHALLINNCQRCHSAGGEASDTQLLITGDVAADYTTVSRLIDTSAPSGSRLLSKASGNAHGGGSVLATGSPEYQIVLQWIQQGARP
jgi:hypothetical protein